eukprot:TRINITY_DN24258_c0_g1_i1.p1 TRINITY_DN24258_c0_g1~~TRINITY_DN24258_c0_g1_i1.p1  ORF type:complete len:746 (+),score=278.81 TRINITY_DN24258_c0_g1_i1:49-2286(+)
MPRRDATPAPPPCIAVALVLASLSLPASASLCTTWATDPVACVRAYNVKWSKLLPDTSTTWVNTMPLGNAEGAANVWTDGKATVSLLVSSPYAWNEGSQLIKVARVDIAFSPSPGRFVSQELDVGTATITVTFDKLKVQVWMDAVGNAAVVTHASTSGDAFTAKATVSPIREEESSFQGPFQCSAYAISADVVTNTSEADIVYHRNEAGYKGQNYFQDIIDQQNLGQEAYGSLPNRLLNRTSGAAVTSQGDTVVVTLLTSQTDTAQCYVDDLVASVNPSPSKAGHDAWWAAYWGRSHVEVPAWNVSSQYALQRYLQGSQGRAPFPIKFNGMLYTAQKPPQTDFRQWGGRNWWQNARLSYYNMFHAGDLDMVSSFLQGYHGTLPLAKARASHYYNTSGAFWPEYTDALFGTQHSQSYGCGRAGVSNSTMPYWWTQDVWNGYNLQGSLDLSLFALDFHAFTGNTTYLDIAAEVVDFYREWRTEKDAEGRVVLYPTQSLETWQCPGYPPQRDNCPVNDLPTIAGLRTVTEKLLRTGYGTAAQRKAWQDYTEAIPLLPLAVQKGQANASLVPAQSWPASRKNVENTELYAVHPYRLYTAGRGGDLSPATIAYGLRQFRSDVGWEQNILDAALLGMATEFQSLAVARAAVGPATGYRFPAFMPHLQDYEPSADHLANLNNAMGYALVQEDEGPEHSLVLLPSWPCSWDVDFKVHGPLGTVVEGRLVSGVLSYTVSPQSRAAHVSARQCQA